MYLNKFSSFYFNDGKIDLVIDGYIIPNKNCKFTNIKDQYKLVSNLYLEYQEDLIHYIKGIFNLIIIHEDKFTCFNDRSGIKKVFFYRAGNDWIISNQISLIKKLISLIPKERSFIYYSLFNSYIDYSTLFKDIIITQPSTQIKFHDFLSINNYWNKEVLLSKHHYYKSNDELLSDLVGILKHNLDSLHFPEVAITLTGGMDSRLILGLLLSQKNRITSFVYGQPDSRDVIASRIIAEAVGVPLFYDSPPAEKFRLSWFKKLSDEIITVGNGMINFHRTHRYHAYKEFSENKGRDVPIVTGHMGGELIRNFFYDDIIISPFAKTWINNKIQRKRKENLRYFLNACFFNEGFINGHFNEIFDELSCSAFLNGKLKDIEFNLTHNLLIPLHHSQDVLLALESSRVVMPFFLDNDIIDLLYGTENTFYYNTEKYINILPEYENQRKICYWITQLSPILADLPLSKRGKYSPNELLENMKISLFYKRLLRAKSESGKYSESFEYTDWFKKYIVSELMEFEANNTFCGIYDINKMKNALNQNEKNKSEKDWRSLSNILFLNNVIKKYC